ncbi:uncharacterized protein MYCFIDRAFT_149329 [Pseudocercospora fijiensis CIRAD86]|uniref:Uncharacterized protein n=1 Tax=Pseudocercospora fijiensis (strain CIRAD86) TaxID=383855 RepID=N1Q7P1_PSEFD|nr:uncharacterized protein MYCFIDRAFT_149329 [Pseudocercospora fijiensis CIRAD86]EME88744.1 hypothetical protein MYCFIDRAFT_149329 [Pseudocercospora fijiensis CIRAD86]
MSDEDGSPNEIDEIGCLTTTCSYQSRRTQALLKRLQQLDLWPRSTLESQSLAECLQSLRNIGPGWLTSVWQCCQRCIGEEFSDSARMVLDFQEKADEFKVLESRFCLSCVREGDPWRILVCWVCKHYQENSRTEE